MALSVEDVRQTAGMLSLLLDKEAATDAERGLIWQKGQERLKIFVNRESDKKNRGSHAGESQKGQKKKRKKKRQGTSERQDSPPFFPYLVAGRAWCRSGAAGARLEPWESRIDFFYKASLSLESSDEPGPLGPVADDRRCRPHQSGRWWEILPYFGAFRALEGFLGPFALSFHALLASGE